MTLGANAKQALPQDDDVSDPQHPVSLSLTSLLESHAALVSEHTETAAMSMSQQLNDLRAVLSDIPASEDDIKRASQLATEVQMVLQYQDRVRQQIDVLRAGIALLAEAHPPPHKGDDAWIESKLAELSGTYVMQEQWDLHNRHLGIEVEDNGEDDDMMFF